MLMFNPKSQGDEEYEEFRSVSFKAREILLHLIQQEISTPQIVNIISYALMIVTSALSKEEQESIFDWIRNLSNGIRELKE